MAAKSSLAAVLDAPGWMDAESVRDAFWLRWRAQYHAEHVVLLAMHLRRRAIPLERTTALRRVMQCCGRLRLVGSHPLKLRGHKMQAGRTDCACPVGQPGKRGQPWCVVRRSRR